MDGGGPARGQGAAPPGAPLVTLHGVTAGYGRRAVVRDVSLELHAGAVTAFIGANGSGKTTLLRVVLGLLRPMAGTVRHARGRPPRVGYSPQIDVSVVRFPVTALEVVLMGLLPRLGAFRRPRRSDRDGARAALAALGVADLAPAAFRDLSGGQRQRVLLARGIVGDPELLVLDEPVRGLDFASSAALVEQMTALAHGRGMALAVATHALDLVANHADRVVLVKDGAARSGPAEQLMTSEVLTAFHGRPVRVATVGGQRVVLP